MTFLAGVVVGLVLPWAVAGLRDLFRGRDDGPEELVRRAREAWGRSDVGHK